MSDIIEVIEVIEETEYTESDDEQRFDRPYDDVFLPDGSRSVSPSVMDDEFI